MDNRRYKKMRVRIALLLNCFIAALFFCVPDIVFCYDSRVAHPNIAGIAASLYNDKYPDSKLTAEEIMWIRRGAEEEDTPTRWLNHFYDPINNKGIFFVKQQLSAKSWYDDSTAQKDFSLGDFAWNTALSDWKNNNKKEALKGLGHVIHIISDMTAPAHTRDDIHAAGDSYEQFLKNNWGTVEGKLNTGFIAVDDINKVFDSLANYSNNNFYSDDTVKDSKYNIISVSKTEVDKDVYGDYYVYFFNNDYRLFGSEDELDWQLRLKNKTHKKNFVNDLFILTDYSTHLLPKAIGYSAGVIKLFIDEAQKFEAKENEGSKISWKGYGDLLLGKIIDKASDIYGDLKKSFGLDNQTAIGEEGDTVSPSALPPINPVAEAPADDSKKQEQKKAEPPKNKKIEQPKASKPDYQTDPPLDHQTDPQFNNEPQINDPNEEENNTNKVSLLDAIKKQKPMLDDYVALVPAPKPSAPAIGGGGVGGGSISNQAQNNPTTEQDDPTTSATTTPEIILPEISLAYPTSSPYATTSTQLNFTGSYNTSTASIFVNNTSTSNLIMQGGIWSMEQKLDIGTSTFSFQGWSEGQVSSSSMIFQIIERQKEQALIQLNAPIILSATTGTTQYASSTQAEVFGSKEENLRDVFMDRAGEISTTTIFTSTTWGISVENLNTGQNDLSFYGNDSSGNISPSSSMDIFVDMEGPIMNSLNATSTNAIVSMEYSAEDAGLGVFFYEIQYLFPLENDFNPESSCNNENTIIKANDDPLLNNPAALLKALQSNNCVWFSFASAEKNANITLNPSMSDASLYIRVRAVDAVNNYGEWKNSGLISSQSANYKIAITEIAWMGTEASTNDEWIELCNVAEEEVDLLNWKLVWGDFDEIAKKYDKEVILESVELPQYYCHLLERTDQSTVSDYSDSQIYAGNLSLNNSGEHLKLFDPLGILIDEVNASGGWFAGDNGGDNKIKASMTKKDYTASGNDPTNWCTFDQCNFPYPHKIKHDADENEIIGSPGDEPVAVL